MADGRSRKAWDYTSALLAMIANTARDAKARPNPYEPRDFNPYLVRRRKKDDRIMVPLSVLKPLFVKDTPNG